MEEIKRLIEARQVEAMKKQLTQKLMCIVKNLGQPIYSDFGFGSGHSASIFDPDAWLTDEEKHGEHGMPTAEGDDYSDVGYIYDALGVGHNFEVRYMHGDKQLRAKYNGYVVYLEEDGKVRGYVPHATWEKLTDDLYAKAKPKDEARKEQEKEEEQASFMKQAAKFLKELRESWGF